MSASAATSRERLKDTPMPEGLKHGPNSWARRVYQCGCRECLPSGRRRGQGTPHSERAKKVRERKWGTPVPETVKHGLYAYRTYGCKCPTCRRAIIVRRKELRPSVGILHVTEMGDGMSTTHWPPLGEGMWECPECHEQFPRRTISA